MELTDAQRNIFSQVIEKQPVSSARIAHYSGEIMVELAGMGLIAASAATGPFGVLWNLTKAGAESVDGTAMPVGCMFCKQIMRYIPGKGCVGESTTICEVCGFERYPLQTKKVYTGIDFPGEG